MFQMSRKKLVVFIGGVALVIVIAAASGLYWFFVYSASKTPPKTLPLTTQPIPDSTVSLVRQLVDIPGDEIPKIASVVASDKLRSQPFFVSSQDGDQVLVFAEAKKVVLFRPSTSKIINIAPLTEDEASSSAQIASASAQPLNIKIDIKNGTKATGLAAKFEPTVKLALPNSQITRENAVSSDYSTSLIIIQNDSMAETGKQLSQKLNIPIGKLPEKETARKSIDLTIILGADKQ